MNNISGNKPDNVIPLQTQERRFDEASSWIAKLDRGLVADEEQSLRRWLTTDKDNQQLFLQMAKLWNKMDDLSRLSDLFPNTEKVTRKPARPYLAVAASLFIAAFLGLWINSNSLPGKLFESASTEYYADAQYYDKVYETAIGEHSTVNLSDGSHIVLNTNSLVKVKFTGEFRLIVLERGEVHVNVAHDKDRPLSVIAGNKLIQAVGTEFNVEITKDDEVELLVTDGKVLVAIQKPHSDKSRPPAPIVLPVSSLAVSKGEQLILGAKVEKVVEVKPEDIKVKLSWQNGNLIFRGETLEEAVAEISRYTQVEFIILNDELKKERITGLFKAGDVDSLLATLRKNFNIRHQRVDGGKVLLSSD